MNTAGIVVIGAGQAAGRAIEAMRHQGYSGAITLIGEENQLPYERPSLSKEVLVQGIEQHINYVNDANWYQQNDVTLTLGVNVTKIEPNNKRVICSDNTRYTYEKLLITTGAKMRQLNLPGAHPDTVHYLRTIEDAKRLRDALEQAQNMVIIGGGFIGLEVAASARRLGVEVALVETGSHLMGRAVPRELAEIVAQKHRQQGVDLYLNNAPESVVSLALDNSTKQNVILRDGQRLKADLIVVGIGVIPNSELAEQAGIATDNGILTDSYCRTNLPDIYAAGDCANQYNDLLGHHLRLESWQNAQNQAVAAAQNICAAPLKYTATPWFWSDQYDVNIQVSGDCNSPEPLVARGVAGEDGFMLFHLSKGVIKGAIGINAGRDMSIVSKLIAANTVCSAQMLSDSSLSMKQIYKAGR